MTRVRLDPTVDVRADGRVLVGGDPLRILRLSAAGAATVARWRVGGEPAGPAEQALADRLIDAAMAHLLPPAAQPSSFGDGARTGRASSPQLGRVAVVVPVRDRPAALERCLAAIAAAGGAESVVVVDDGSDDAVAHARVAESAGARLVRLGDSRGPAGARTAGVAAVAESGGSPALVAFVDSDVEVDAGWLDRLVPLFDDPSVALAAPRVVHTSLGPPTVVDRYEAAASALDLGDRPGPIRPGGRVAYVPAAALVVRRGAFDAVGGFDAALDVGEDVDLVWRLDAAGHRCRYEPEATVVHRGRSMVGAMLRRRYDYGRSAAELDLRHPGDVPPFRSGGWSVAVVALLAGAHPVAAGALGVVNTASLVRRLRPSLGADALPVAATLVGRGHLGAVRTAARAAVRPWWPLTFAAALGSRRARRVLVVAAVGSSLDSWRRLRPALDPVRWTALALADDVAYGAGVWMGCARRRRLGPLLPVVTWRRPTGQN